MATSNDVELQKMLAKWSWMGGGVLPNIHRVLLPDAMDELDEDEDDDEGLPAFPLEPVLTQDYARSIRMPSRKKAKRVGSKKVKRVSRKKSKRVSRRR